MTPEYIQPLRGVPSRDSMNSFDNPAKMTKEELMAENELLRGMAAKYWVLRDAINWQITAGQRVPKAIRMIFEAQMAEIDAEMQR